MDALLARFPSTQYGTLGRLHLSQGPKLWTMEPPWKDNRRGLSCIIATTYQVVPHISPRYGRCYLVKDTCGRTYILFHPGNFGGDKEMGLKTHTLGCILPGLRAGWLDYKGKPQRAVLSSRTAFRHLDEWAGRKPFELEIAE